MEVVFIALGVTHLTHSNCFSLDSLCCQHCTRIGLTNSNCISFTSTKYLSFALWATHFILSICISYNSPEFISLALWTTHLTHSFCFSSPALLLQWHIELLSWLHLNISAALWLTRVFLYCAEWHHGTQTLELIRSSLALSYLRYSTTLVRLIRCAKLTTAATCRSCRVATCARRVLSCRWHERTHTHTHRGEQVVAGASEPWPIVKVLYVFSTISGFGRM